MSMTLLFRSEMRKMAFCEGKCLTLILGVIWCVESKINVGKLRNYVVFVLFVYFQNGRQIL